MLTADVRFEGFTATDWTRFLSMFKPQRISGEAYAAQLTASGVKVKVERIEGAQHSSLNLPLRQGFTIKFAVTQ